MNSSDFIYDKAELFSGFMDNYPQHRHTRRSFIKVGEAFKPWRLPQVGLNLAPNINTNRPKLKTPSQIALKFCNGTRFKLAITLKLL